MAGIGFELQQLARKEGLLNQIGALGHAAVIAAGPWIFTIIAITMITVLTEARLGLETLGEFRVLVIYAFALSLLTTAPVVIIATRMVSDAIFDRHFHLVSHIFFAALTYGALVTLIVTLLVYGGVFALAPLPLVTATLTCVLVGLIWISLAFCSAVRDYTGITIGFLAGLALSVAGAIWSVSMGYEAIGLLWSFNFGLAFILFWLMSRVLLTFPDPITRPRKALRIFLTAGRRYWLMGLAAMISVIALWIDKWIMWLGPAGETLPVGLVHAPLYDSAMFVAYLVIIPSLSLFILNLETDFFTRYQRYYADIKAHATLRQIRDNAQMLARETRASLARIMVVQVALCAVMILISPLLIDLLSLQYRQAGILRLGAIGALFQFLFLASSSLLLFFNRNGSFLRLQLLFLGLNAALTLVSIALGPDTYGFGYLLASLFSSMAALLVLEKALDELNYFTFMSAATAKREDNWLLLWERG